MSGYTYITLRDRPQYKERAAAWFHSKWECGNGMPELSLMQDARMQKSHREAILNGFLHVAGPSPGHKRYDLPGLSPLYTRGRQLIRKIFLLAVSHLDL